MLRFMLNRPPCGDPPAERPTRPAVEALEARHLMAASPIVARLLVPAYFVPGDGPGWDRMAAAATTVPLTAILNPNSGPGRKADPSYVAAVNKLRGSGGRVVGYVSTRYGKRSLDAVKADIRAYKSFYGIDGIFLDEMDNRAARLPYYRSLYTFIKKLNPRYQVIGNPGTNTLEKYLTAPTADVLVDFEDPNGYGTSKPSDWVSRYSSCHFGNLLTDVATASAMSADVATARKRNAGYVFVTDDGPDGNPYDRLPSYWDQEVALVRAENRG